jgi:hypothetical protein
MGGGGGGGGPYYNVPPEELNRRIKEATQEIAKEFVPQVQTFLDSKLTAYNDRNVQLIQHRQDEVLSHVEDLLDATLDLKLGGSVAKRGLDTTLLSTPNSTFTESDLLREIAWVILCSGFRERVVRHLFWKISLCFFDWSSAATIRNNASICVATALDVFRSKPKITAIAQSAALIEERGFETICRDIIASPVCALQRFPFIGEVTAFHLAKNLGFDVPRPDRHLQRLSILHGYTSVHEFCVAISNASGDSVRNIDTLLWRISEMGLGTGIYFPSIALSFAPTQTAFSQSP